MIRITTCFAVSEKWCCRAICHQPAINSRPGRDFEATHRLIYGAKDDSGQRYLAGLDTVPVSEPREIWPAPEFNTGDHASWWLDQREYCHELYRNLDSETGAMVRLLEDGD